MLVGPLDQNGAAQRVGAAFHESVLLIAQGVLVHVIGMSQIGDVDIVNRIARATATRQSQSLHVSLLSAS